MIENQIIPDHPLENPAILGLVHASGATLGAGVGMLLAQQLGGTTRKATGITLVVTGAVLMAPLVVASIVKGLRRSNTPGMVRRRIKSIREGDGVGDDYLHDLDNPDVTVR